MLREPKAVSSKETLRQCKGMKVGWSHPSCFSETRLSSITGSMSCVNHVKNTGPSNTSKSMPVGDAAQEGTI